jgi:hypothetical protein
MRPLSKVETRRGLLDLQPHPHPFLIIIKATFTEFHLFQISSPRQYKYKFANQNYLHDIHKLNINKLIGCLATII